MKNRRSPVSAVAAFLSLILMIACNFNVNESIVVPDGETRDESLNTVNGDIIIGQNCRIEGSCRAVNGRIEVGRGSHVGRLQAINGPIDVHADVRVGGNIEAVNGPITLDSGVDVFGSVHSVNGKIVLKNTAVAEDVKTQNGTIVLQDHSLVRGDIVVEEPSDELWSDRPLVITIADSSTVEGNVVVKDADPVQVEVHLMNGGQVKGTVQGAKLVRGQETPEL